jgi:hypothetical protein
MHLTDTTDEAILVEPSVNHQSSSAFQKEAIFSFVSVTLAAALR